MSSSLVSHRVEHTNNHSVASFLLKTFQILEKSQFSDVISWVYDDDTFAIKNILKFTNQILPKYFRHRNFSSFVRQLNMYDFHKIKQSNDYIVFRNPLFKKGHSHLLKKIRRKAPRKNESQRKINSTVGINHIQQNVQLRTNFQNNIQDSMSIFQKSVVSLETLYSLINKKQNHISHFSTSQNETTNTSQLLNKIIQMKNFANSSFKISSNINNSIAQALNQKQLKYAKIQNNSLFTSPVKFVSMGSLFKSQDNKSQCSIGIKKQSF